MKKSKASKGTKGRAAAKDLRVGKRSGDAVKGGSDHERQSQREPAPGGSASGASPIQASISTTGANVPAGVLTSRRPARSMTPAPERSGPWECWTARSRW